MKSGVYRIDMGNGWFYVGSSYDLMQREYQHRSGLVTGTHGNRIMRNVYAKYGVFEFTVLGRYPVDDILAHEQALLDEHHGDPKCANVASTAGSCLGVKRSAETRAKIGAAQAGVRKPPQTAEHRAAIGAAVSAATKGKGKARFSPEHRAALSASLSDYWARKRASQECA